MSANTELVLYDSCKTKYLEAYQTFIENRRFHSFKELKVALSGADHGGGLLNLLHVLCYGLEYTLNTLLY